MYFIETAVKDRQRVMVVVGVVGARACAFFGRLGYTVLVPLGPVARYSTGGVDGVRQCDSGIAWRILAL